jgi:hypothetical protein
VAVTAQRVLFIGGLGRSGSTLIERLLNEFADAVAVGETVHLWERGVRDNERCSCGEPFHSCRFWNQVGETGFGGWSQLDLDRAIELRWSVDRSRRLPAMVRAHRRGEVAGDQREYLELVGSVLSAAGGVARAHDGADVVIDSSKHLSSAVLYSLDPRLDVRALHLIRDPRGVAFSNTKAVARPESSGAATTAQMPTYSPARTAGRWVTDNLGYARVGRLGIPTMRLRYEDFLAQPIDSLAEIARFAGLPTTELPREVFDGNVGELRMPMHSVSGNPLRFGGHRIALRHDETWRTGLPRSQQRLVSAITAPARRVFGY